MPILENIRRLFSDEATNPPTNGIDLPPSIVQYAASSYPSNHTFRIKEGRLVPLRKLRKRFNTIAQLYPTPLTSLLDIGCSKGFFVLTAAQSANCERALGIDITHKEVLFCNQIKDHLNISNAQFELMQLDQLAGRIDDFGGPFQTVLVVNLYQYLYFGSDHFSGCYLNHDMIFKLLNDVTAKRIIFNNRITLADCQNQSWVEHAGTKSSLYCEKNIHEAAENYFHVKKQGTYGRYPLWILEKK